MFCNEYHFGHVYFIRYQQHKIMNNVVKLKSSTLAISISGSEQSFLDHENNLPTGSATCQI